MQFSCTVFKRYIVTLYTIYIFSTKVFTCAELHSFIHTAINKLCKRCSDTELFEKNIKRSIYCFWCFNLTIIVLTMVYHCKTALIEVVWSVFNSSGSIYTHFTRSVYFYRYSLFICICSFTILYFIIYHYCRKSVFVHTTNILVSIIEYVSCRFICSEEACTAEKECHSCRAEKFFV